MDPLSILELRENAYRSLCRALVTKGELDADVESLMQATAKLLNVNEERALSIEEEVHKSLAPPDTTTSYLAQPSLPRMASATAPVSARPRDARAAGGMLVSSSYPLLGAKHDPQQLIGGTVERYMPHLGVWAQGRIVSYEPETALHYVEYLSVVDAAGGTYVASHNLSVPDAETRNLQPPAGARQGKGMARPASLSLASPGTGGKSGGKSKRAGVSMAPIISPVATPAAGSHVKSGRGAVPSVAQLKKSSLEELHQMLIGLSAREREILSELVDVGCDENDMELDDLTRLYVKWEVLDRKEAELNAQLAAMG